MSIKLSLRRKTKPFIITGLIVFVTLGALGFGVSYINKSRDVEALSAADWSAGNIIDDGVFTNSRSMTSTDVQSFLSAKVPVCDTNGTQPSEFGGGTRAQWAANASLHPIMGAFYPPFTCLKDYQENSQSAAQIIYNIAQTYQINPQVLLVLLQKEQTLVTDTWPSPGQYKTATGYGCPDTTVCDTKYYGLTQQLTWAATMYHAIASGTSSWSNPYGSGSSWYTPYLLGDNTIRYNPDVSCGGTTITIQNRATQALYNYTPYQPNQSTVNWKLGTGPSVSSAYPGCGAFGNINFLTYFNSWFGSTHYFGNKASATSLYSHQSCTIGDFTGYVARLYQPDSGDYLYTTSKTEACYAITIGYIYDGPSLKTVPQITAGSTPIYRVEGFSKHYYTASLSERNTLLATPGYYDEGIAWYALATSGTGTIPVMSFSTPNGGSFLTAAIGEANSYQADYGYTSKGIAFYQQTEGSSPGTTNIYRLSKNNMRLYTSSEIEKNIAISQYNYVDEGILNQGDASPNQNNTPIYRLRGSTGYLYTASRKERDLAVINYNYVNEGTGFYALVWSNKPIFRLTNNFNGLRLFSNNDLEKTLATSNYGYIFEGVSWYSY